MASNGGDLFKGFLLGGLVGVALGVLFAPKTGEDIREHLKGESDDLVDKAKEELEKIKADLGDLRSKISETIERGKSMFEQELASEEKEFEAEMAGGEEEVKEETPKTPRRRRTTKKKADKDDA